MISAAVCVWASASAQIVSFVNFPDDLASPQNTPNQYAMTVSKSSVTSLYTANPNQLGLQAELAIPPTVSVTKLGFVDTATVPKYDAHVPEPSSILAAIALLVPLSVSFLQVFNKKAAL